MGKGRREYIVERISSQKGAGGTIRKIDRTTYSRNRDGDLWVIVLWFLAGMLANIVITASVLMD